MISKFEIGKTYIFKKEIADKRLNEWVTKGFNTDWAIEIDNRIFKAKFENLHVLEGRDVLPNWCEEVML